MSQQELRIVHLGDLHFHQTWVWPWQLLGKRALGQTNLWLNRRRRFRQKLWPEFAKRIAELAPDLILASGDMSTTSLLGEFAQARRALEALPHAPLRVVPGNHDRYTIRSHRRREFEACFAPWTATTWPARWREKGVEIIGLDPTRPTVLHASGSLSPEAMQRLSEFLRSAPPGPVIVLCHYPLGTPPNMPDEPRHHALEQRRELRAALARSGRPIVYLHGHVHKQWFWRPKDAPNVQAINGGAPMMLGKAHPFGQGFLQIHLSPSLSASVTRHFLWKERTWACESLEELG